MSKRTTIITLVLLVVLAAGLTWYIRRRAAAWSWPVQGRISSGYEHDRVNPVTGAVRDHLAIDIAVPVGTPVKAARDGVVKSSYITAEGGQQLILQHGEWLSGYAHLSERRVNVGDTVKRGHVIALSGNTGASTGPHVHFTITNPAGLKVDPQPLLA